MTAMWTNIPDVLQIARLPLTSMEYPSMLGIEPQAPPCGMDNVRDSECEQHPMKNVLYAIF
jgi:hypothetical protein